MHPPAEGPADLKLADGAVTTAKLADNAVTTAKIVNDAVTTLKIANLNVTTAKIADLNVTSGKIADGAVLTVKLADGEAIGTSGDYQRYFELDGQRYPHLLDPRTAQPAAHTQAVTVLIPAGSQSGTLSDALSKPIFIAGPAGWRDMARKLDSPLVMRVDANGQVQVTEALEKRLEFIAGRPEITVVP